MTEAERIAKNEIIRQKGKETRLKRKNQVCKVFCLKIDFSHLNIQQRTALKMFFVEAKWLYNDAITFISSQDINNYDYKVKTVQGLDKDRNSITRELEYLGSQMKQSVIHVRDFIIEKNLGAIHLPLKLKEVGDFLRVMLKYSYVF